MAVSLTLTDGTTTYNLLTGALKLRYQGWEMQGPLAEGEMTLQGYGAAWKFTGFQPITETFELYAAAAATELAIRQAITTIDDLLENARMWHNNRTVAGVAVRLQFNTDAEATRSCLIYNGAITMLSGNGAQPTLKNNNALALLTLIRHPLWETANSIILASTTYDTYGGRTAALTVSGTAPARVNVVSFGAPVAQATALTRLWFGILPTGLISRTNFVANWPLTSGTIATTPVNPMAASVADADGIGANVIQTQFTASGHADLHEFVSISLSQIDGDVNHWEQWRGTYRILCRCKVGAATNVGMQLGWGGTAAAGAQQWGTEIIVTNTAYKWVDLGECTIPIEARSLSTWHGIDHTFHLKAERISGANELSVDYLVLMPSVHMIYVDNANIIGSTDAIAYVECDYVDAVFCYQLNAAATGGIYNIPDLAARDFYVPVNTGGVGVVVAERSAQHTETDDINVAISVYPRWRTYKDS